MKNWFNMDEHPTDAFVHWSDMNPMQTAINLRMYYNKVANLGLQAELDFLLKTAYNAGKEDQKDVVTQ